MKNYSIGHTSQPLSSQSQKECDRILRDRPHCLRKFGADVAYPQPHLLHAFQTFSHSARDQNSISALRYFRLANNSSPPAPHQLTRGTVSKQAVPIQLGKRTKTQDIQDALDCVLAHSKWYMQEVLKKRHNEHPSSLAIHRLLHTATL